ncbi:MAG TPA: hypothetical protein VFO77_12610 [Actinoplanes sp.]|nr:hypothetical protein [Actinoplanes sp.]
MSQLLRVDVAGLRSLGEQVRGQGESLARDVTREAAQLVPQGRGTPPQWAGVAAAHAAARGWEQFLSGLGARVESAGRSMVDAANGYQGCDDRAGQRLPRGEVRVP